MTMDNTMCPPPATVPKTPAVVRKRKSSPIEEDQDTPVAKRLLTREQRIDVLSLCMSSPSGDMSVDLYGH